MSKSIRPSSSSSRTVKKAPKSGKVSRKVARRAVKLATSARKKK